MEDTVSSPYVSAPSSPGRGPPYSYTGGFFYSAPASPVHHQMTSSFVSSTPLEDAGGSFEFELTSEPPPLESMTSADELFFNGQIRPMKLSSHLQHPQDLEVENNEEHEGDEDRTFGRGRAFQSRDRRRKARSMSPLRSNTAFQWLEELHHVSECTEITEIINEKIIAEHDEEEEDKLREDAVNDNDNETPSSGASSRSSSIGQSSKRWVFLKELLYRSKSEGRNSTTTNNNNNNNRNHRFWSTLTFAPTNKKPSVAPAASTSKAAGAADEISPPPPPVVAEGKAVKSAVKKAVNGVGVRRKRRVGRSASAHEVHYTRNRAQAEEMRKKTYLPYRQGLLGCLGFSSKSYGAINGFARALNPVSSR